MALTGKLGTQDSKLGNMVLGVAGDPLAVSASSSLVLDQRAATTLPINKTASSALSLTDAATNNFKKVFADSVLAMSDSARVPVTVTKVGASTLSLTDLAHVTNTHVYAVSTIDFASQADNRVKARSIVDTIELTDAATAESSILVVSTLTLTQLAIQGTLTVTATSALALTSEARGLNLNARATSALVLTDSNHVVRPWRVSATSPLTTVESVFDLATFSFIDVESGLTQEATVIVDAPRFASNIISFATSATQYILRSDAIEALAESVLSLTSAARTSLQSDASNSITMSQAATAVVGTELRTAISVTDAASANISYGSIDAENTIEINQAVSYIFEKSNTLCTYSPFVGSSSDPNAPTPPPSTYTAAGATPGFRLQYPSTGTVTDELILRAPNLGNIDRLSMTRINRETRGGTLVIFADPIWPKVQTLLLSFSGLSADEGQDLLEFMESHIGEEIRLIDWEDRLWTGVITDPQSPVVQDGKGCQYTASFEFEGEKV